MTDSNISPQPPGSAEADSIRFSTGALRDFYRDVLPGDWRNRPLPRPRRWYRAIDFPLRSDGGGPARR